MLIEVLGLPGERTAALEAALAQALTRFAADDRVRVRRIHDMGAMIARGVRQPPALRIDGRVVCRRHVPSAAEIRAYLEEAAEA
jgi:hypothetical protein